MGGMSDYALEVALNQRKGKRRSKNEERNNQPLAARDTAMNQVISDLIARRESLVIAEKFLLAWNAGQPSPMKVGMAKQRIYLAYKEAGLIANR